MCNKSRQKIHTYKSIDSAWKAKTTTRTQILPYINFPSPGSSQVPFHVPPPPPASP